MNRSAEPGPRRALQQLAADDRLTQGLWQMLRKEAGGDIGTAARRIADDELDRLAGPGLRVCGRGGDGERRHRGNGDRHKSLEHRESAAPEVGFQEPCY